MGPAAVSAPRLAMAPLARAAMPPAPEVAKDAADPKEPFYGSRWERSFAMTPQTADRLQQFVAQYIAPDTDFPNPERIQTVYVRAANPYDGPKEKLRIRTYPD